jgi:hypothetical protein
LLTMVRRPPVFDHEIPAFPIAAFGQTAMYRSNVAPRRIRKSRVEIPDHQR